MNLLIWAFLLFLAGIGLAAAEIFIPSAGVLALLSLGAFIAAVTLAFEVSAAWGIGLLLAAPLVVTVVVVKGFSILPRTWVGRRMILGAPGKDEESGHGSASQEVGDSDTALQGLDGVTCTDLRPSGSAEIDGRRYSVVSVGDFIRAGAQIRVVDVAGNRVVVEEIQ